ncbi:PH domain-containing protein [Microbacterium sp. GXF7504]
MTAPAPAPALVRSPLSDGAWHRPHPLTPLLRGGLALLVVAGVVVANLRERLVAMVLPWFRPDDVDWEQPRDPVDWVLANDLSVVAASAVLAVIALLVLGFTLAWRFHTFRITGDDVEVRSGVLFRSHRRAPLDRVQGVNLTRPFVARFLGLAKLEVLGAGTSGNVKLEYLRLHDAETVRADILRLASGLTLSPGTDAAAPGLRENVARGITGLVDGDEARVESASVVDLPAGRLILAQLLDTATVGAVCLLVAGGVVAVFGPPWVLFLAVPAALALLGYQVRQVLRFLRYSIAPTPDGVRVAFGLLTSVTEILPPGRVHAVQLVQPLLWRPAGWWTVKINRLSGREASDTGADQLTTVLLVGTLDEVDRVLDLLLPGMAEDVRRRLLETGLAPSVDDDPFATTPRRARLLRPITWRRNGALLADGVLAVRKGLVWRTLVLVPLARLQSVAVRQGPLTRAFGAASIDAHTVKGPVVASIGALDRDDAVWLWDGVAAAAVAAASADRTHRWADTEPADDTTTEEEP